MIETTPFDPAEVLTDRASIVAYLDEAFATGDPAFVDDALVVVARARGMDDLVRDDRLQARAPDPAGDGDPPLAPIFRLLQALGVRLSISAAE